MKEPTHEINEYLDLNDCRSPAVTVIKPRLDAKGRKELLDAARTSGSAKAGPGPDAARSHDFLYEENGLPR